LSGSWCRLPRPPQDAGASGPPTTLAHRRIAIAVHVLALLQGVGLTAGESVAVAAVGGLG
jgi:hypothetical protein